MKQYIDDVTQVRRGLALLHSIILCGEKMTSKAEDEYDAALAALARLENTSEA